MRLVWTVRGATVGSSLPKCGGAATMWGIKFCAIFIAILVSEPTSNTAAANTVIPVMISLFITAGINPAPPAIRATLRTGWGFMLPVSTPRNAIAYGSGAIPLTRMMRAGVLLDTFGGLLLWVGLRIMLPVIGLA